MTLDISAIRQRIEKAQPEKWKRTYDSENRRFILEAVEFESGDLIAHAPADLRALCDELEAVRELLKRADAYVDCAPWLSEDIHKYLHGGSAPSVPTDESPKEEGKK